MCSCKCHEEAATGCSGCYSNHKKPVYRVGQRIRIEWPNGSVVEGVLKKDRYGNTFSVVVPRAGGEETKWQPDATVGDNRVVTILSEPRPDEPTRVGAVIKEGDASTLLFVKNGKFWMGPTGVLYQWDEFKIPVIVWEGMPDGCE